MHEHDRPESETGPESPLGANEKYVAAYVLSGDRIAPYGLQLAVVFTETPKNMDALLAAFNTYCRWYLGKTDIILQHPRCMAFSIPASTYAGPDAPLPEALASVHSKVRKLPCMPGQLFTALLRHDYNLA